MRRKRRAGCLPACLAVLCLCLGAGCITAALMKEKGDVPALVREVVQKAAQENIPFREIAVTEEEVEGKFYYSFLDDTEKQVYKEILDGLRENADTIYLHSKDGERVNLIFQNVLDDHPEIFWCEGTATATTFPERPGQDAYAELAPQYAYSGSDKERMLAEIETAAKNCLSQIPEEATEYEKIKFVYEYLINTVDYRIDAPDNQNIYSALVNHASVCAGYARSTQYLLEKAGIYCAYVTGTAVDGDGNPENHAWNLVRCNGNYYFVDTTWGDPVFIQETGVSSQGEAPLQKRAMTYDYLCCSGRELLKTHTLEEGYAYPECVREDLNYYRLNGMYYESPEPEQIRDQMYRSIDRKEETIVFKFADENVYQQAHDVILEELVRDAAAYLGRSYGLNEVRYSYEEERTLCKLTIYWSYE